MIQRSKLFGEFLQNDSNWTKNCFCSVSDRPGGGAAGGPSGMTADHLQPILESGRDAVALASFATSLAQGEVPPEALEGIRMGRITALSKPDGGVRGTVVGDILRRLVARTISKQIMKEAEEATAPTSTH